MYCLWWGCLVEFCVWDSGFCALGLAVGCFLAGGFWIDLDGVVWCFGWLFLLCVGLHNITFSVCVDFLVVVLVIWLRFWLVCGVWVCSLQLAVGGLGLRFGLVCRLDAWFLIGGCMVVILAVWWCLMCILWLVAGVFACCWVCYNIRFWGNVVLFECFWF